MNGALIVLGLFFILPLWYYLMYTLISAAHVDRLVWFLFYLYMATNFVAKCLAVAVDWKKK